ncbi:MAG: hypothetical protein ACFB4J_08580 [Elainellaceae cyanobacterium]
MFQTEFEFTLPKGYLDGEGNLHRTGVMRLAKAIDEIVPLKDPRVQANPAYATVVILSRVITQLGALEEVNTAVIEGLFAADLNYLYNTYRQVNELDDGRVADGEAIAQSGTQSSTGAVAEGESPLAALGTEEG